MANMLTRTKWHEIKYYLLGIVSVLLSREISDLLQMISSLL